MRKYGWKRELPDFRDLRLKRDYSKELPQKVELRTNITEVFDQGDLGSCTANAIAQLHHYVQKKESHQAIFMPSRLFIYYNERKRERTISYDSGAQIRDGIKTLVKQGACPEILWPYITGRFTTEPPVECYATAKKFVALEYRKIVGLGDLMQSLYQGYPVVFGFSVYESFESPETAKSGIVTMPKAGERMLGGHAVMAVGYDGLSNTVTVLNSWGPGWGDRGFFHMPFDYIDNTNLADDFWTITKVL